MQNIIKIDCRKLNSFDSFHTEFHRAFGFPDFYGRNLDAWIDCMSSLAEPEEKMTSIHCNKGAVVTLFLENSKWLKTNHLEIYETLIEGVAFVNYRLMEVGEPSVLALAFHH